MALGPSWSRVKAELSSTDAELCWSNLGHKGEPVLRERCFSALRISLGDLAGGRFT